nr:hypothetical protein [Tanacetum cinerariifolium]
IRELMKDLQCLKEGIIFHEKVDLEDGTVNINDTMKQILEPLSKMTKGNKKQYIVDVKFMNYLLQAIPNDIYNSVDACKNAKEMWEQIKRLMFGSDVTSHDVRADIQTKNACYGGNGNKNVGRQSRNQSFNAGNENADSNQIIQRAPQTESIPGKANVQCYNCHEKGHHARDCQKPRVRDANKVNASSKVHEQMSNVKRKTTIQTSIDDQIDSNIIFDDPYVENNGENK